MTKYVLSPNAARSLESIKTYTSEQFGRHQEQIYLKKLRDRFNYLAEYPERGRPRNEIEEGYFSYFEGAHTIYYKIINQKIAIIDVLHQSMEPKRHLLDSSPVRRQKSDTTNMS